MPAEKSAPQADRPFVISREFNARRDIVWKSWTEAERLKQWWGPKGFTVQWEAYEATDLERKTFQDGMASMQQGWTGTFEQFSDYLARAVREGRK